MIGAKLCICILSIGLFGIALPIHAQNRELVYNESTNKIIYGGTNVYVPGMDSEDRRKYRYSIYMHDVETGSDDPLWSGEVPIHSIGLSPEEDRVSFIEPVRIVQDEYVQDSTLRVINLDGDEITNIDGVRRYAWSPDGRKIAYQGGPYVEKPIDFISQGTRIYDLDSETSRKVYDRGVGLHWAGFDGTLYIWRGFSGVVMRYVPSRDVIEDTPYSDIYFSPGGEYYYRPSYEGSGFELYLREPNEDVTDDWDFLSIRSNRIYPRGWIGERTLVIPDRRGSSHGDYLFDLDEDIARRASGQIIDYTQDQEGIFVLTPDGIITEQVGDLEIVSPQGEEHGE